MPEIGWQKHPFVQMPDGTLAQRIVETCTFFKSSPNECTNKQMNKQTIK